ncbi:MAG: T9SS C-terminal target domain-containing protein [Ignavibacteriae bacterium]|nr:MAG: T9SS C-terminal target domain-containing protein [Ignavibacteriota bacterium]
MKPEKFKIANTTVQYSALKNLLTLFLFLSLITLSYAGNFTVHNVTEFQTALNTAASNGQNDTINVVAGTYNVNPELTFTSNENYFIFIKGAGFPLFEGGNTRRILQLTSNANGDIFVEGLVIQHGRADYGGGLNILTQTADISLKNCTFNDNTALNVAGGVNIFSNTGNITVTNCTFRRNSSPNTTGYPLGTAGGLFVQTDGTSTSISMTGCLFEQNTAQRDAAGAMLYPLGSNSTVTAESNTFDNNTAKEFGGGCWIRCPGGTTTVKYRNNTLTGNSSSVAGSGGGTYIQITSGVINLFDNIHKGNTATWQGGGLWIEHGGGSMNIFRNIFTDNTSNQTGGGANIFLDNGFAKIDHNIFNENRATDAGGGVNISTTTGRVDVCNNTFYLNNSMDGGDVYFYFDNSSSSANFFNNILYNSSDPALSFSGQQTVTARYSDIQGGTGQTWFGTGCKDIYPFFADSSNGDFHLQDSIHCSDIRYSPCIDAGDPAAQDSLLTCDWGLGIIRSDMGAYGGKISFVIGIKKIYSNIPEEYHLSQNYPNPFNPTTNIEFSIPQNSLVALKVFDVLGREIKTLINENLNAGTYKIDFDASAYTSGVYYYRMECGNYFETRKMILLK